MSHTTVVFPGTFDPITNGHIDLIKRGARLFGRIIVAIAENPNKRPLFHLEERVALVKAALAGEQQVEVVGFQGLLVNLAQQYQAVGILRGLRAVSDFEYEFQLANMNRHLVSDIETLFLTPSERYTFISSTLVKEVSQFGGSISAFVPPVVEAALLKKFNRE